MIKLTIFGLFGCVDLFSTGHFKLQNKKEKEIVNTSTADYWQKNQNNSVVQKVLDKNLHFLSFLLSKKHLDDPSSSLTIDLFYLQKFVRKDNFLKEIIKNFGNRSSIFLYWSSNSYFNMVHHSLSLCQKTKQRNREWKWFQNWQFWILILLVFRTWKLNLSQV